MLGVACSSPQIVEAVYKFSHVTHAILVLECTRNQVSSNKNSWTTTKDLIALTNILKRKYPDAQVELLRSNLGPSSTNKKELVNVFNTIDEDLKLGINFFHLDFSPLKGSNLDVASRQAEAIRYIQRRNPQAMFQLGSNFYARTFSYNNLQNLVEYYIKFVKPLYWIIDSGSEVKEDFQHGVFNYERVRSLKNLLANYDIKLKENSGDFISSSPQKIELREGLVDYFSLTHELGQIQTDLTLALADEFKLDSMNVWLEEVYKTKAWKDILFSTDANDLFNCASFVGKNYFGLPSYQRIVKQLNEVIPFDDLLQEKLMTCLNSYGPLLRTEN